MWCDYGTAHGTASFASGWWNKAQCRGLAIISRCEVVEASDFDNLEYGTYLTLQRRKEV